MLIPPSLGGDFGPSFKVAGGYAFVDDNWYPHAVDSISSPDPLTTCFGGGHGTHVLDMLLEISYISSLMLSRNCGNGRPSQYWLWGDWSGPRSFSLHYRIFSCVSDDTTDNIIMDAMIQAAADRVDVISIVDLASLASIHSFHLKFNH
jgi:hypothetical protein